MLLVCTYPEFNLEGEVARAEAQTHESEADYFYLDDLSVPFKCLVPSNGSAGLEHLQCI